MSVKRARSASEEFSIYLTDADAAPPESSSTLTSAQGQAHQAAATAVLPGSAGGTEASFKSARTRNHTSPTARSPLHQQQQQQLLYSNSANSLTSERIDMATPASGSGKSHLAVASSTSGTPALSSSSHSSNQASSMSPPNSAETLDARVFGGFGDLYQSSASPQPSTSLQSKPPSQQQQQQQAYGSNWQQRQGQPWSTYTSPLGYTHAASPYAGPHSGGSGSSYRGSMDDTLGFGAGYGVPPSTALAGLGLDGSSPLGFSPTASTSATAPSASVAPPSTASSGATMFGLDPAAAASLPPPPQQPLPAPPTTPQVAQQAFRPGPSLQQQQQNPQQQQQQQWRTMSPLSFGFRETRKGQDLGLGLEDLEVIETLGEFGRVFSLDAYHN